jgi:hypothetical protein
MFTWRMTRPVNRFGPIAGLPLVGLGSFAVQTSIESPHYRTASPHLHAPRLSQSIAEAGFLSMEQRIEAGLGAVESPEARLCQRAAEKLWKNQFRRS